LNSQKRLIWTRTAMQLAGVAFCALAVGLLFGATWGWRLSTAVFLMVTLRHAHHLARLSGWLQAPHGPVPQGSGMWEEVFSGLYRLDRQTSHEREEIAAELARFRSAASAMPDAVVILDAHQHIEWCNPTAERFFEIEARRDAGLSLLNLVRAPDLAAYLAGERFDQPLVLRMARGEGLVLSLRIVPYGQERKLLLSRDVTQAERIEGMRRDFVANVSHELKTPLTVVHGFVETLSDGEVPFTEIRRCEVMQLMRQQTDRMLQLIEDLLTLSALESAPGQASRTPVSAADLLAAAQAEALALSGGRHSIEVQAGPAALILGDDKDLRSVCGNLMSNAIRYTPKGGRVSIAWRIRESGEGEIAVSDSGIGIERRHIPRLTERFYRVDHSRSRETGGTGLGLAIVKHVLNRHEAVLEVDSELGKGSCFKAVIPIHRVRAGEDVPAVQSAGV
jgi:two-component system, OmpR family, phosphate regulon sensor histidine kinase PhoR